MDFTLLNKMTDADLALLETAVKEARKRRLTNQLEYGAICEFKDRNGLIRQISITRVNAKSISGNEVNVATGAVQRNTWRVAPSLLKVVKSSRMTTVAPKTATGTTW